MRSSDFAVFLKIRHADVDPVRLTEAFGIVPECCWRAGEAKTEANEAGATRRESYWVAEVPSMPAFPALEGASPEAKRAYASVEGTLMFGALLLGRRKDFWAELQAEGASAELIVLLGLSSLSRFELPRDLLSLLSKFGLSVSIELRDATEAAA